MNGNMSILFLSVLGVLLSIATPSMSNPVVGDYTYDDGRPARPDVFSSPEELRTYLNQLKNYYALISRPRFGKRWVTSDNYEPANMNKPTLNELPNLKVNSNAMKLGPPSESSNRRYPSSPRYLYDLLNQYDE